MASTTIDTDTELSAVNSILGAIGQSPVTSIVKDNPEIGFIYNLLRDANVDLQAEGWHFNTDFNVSYKPDSTTGKIAIGNDVLQLDVTDGWATSKYDVVKRNGNLYDKRRTSDDWSTTSSILLDRVMLLPFEDLPTVFKRFIIARASRVAATQLVANPQLTALLAQQEQLARAACTEYECTQGNHNMLGLPSGSSYSTYAPWRNLRR